MNPNPNSVASPLLSGAWVLEYTTSDTILGKSGKGSLFQGGQSKVGEVIQELGILHFILYAPYYTHLL